MQNLFITINNGLLKVFTVSKEGIISSLSAEMSGEVVSDTKILDTEAFSDSLMDIIPKVTKTPLKSLNLIFLVEPTDSYLRFVTVKKTTENIDEIILKNAQEQITDAKIEDLYFSYKKLAPFLYQFIAVKKEFLEKYIEVSNKTGISLRGVFPWLILLPKYVNPDKPCIFISMSDKDQIIALSELNGIFYSDVYAKEKKIKDIESLVSSLSLYKKSMPMNTIYTLNYKDFDLKNCEIIKIDLPEKVADLCEGYEINALANYVTDINPNLYLTQKNLLNLLPLPVEVKSSRLPVPVAVTAGVLLMVAFVSGFFYLKTKQGNAVIPQSEVLSENIDANKEPEKEIIPETPKDAFNRSDITIRIENGSGISGLAASTKEKAEELGYKVVSIDTADEQREKTLLRFKKTKLEHSEAIEGDFKEYFPSTTISDDLEEDADYDLLIIAGTTANM